jgi:hypothetical protein
MFGFFGIILGPVLMILIVTTISVYLAVYKGVAMNGDGDGDGDGGKLRKRLGRKRKTDAPLPAEVEPVLPGDDAATSSAL